MELAGASAAAEESVGTGEEDFETGMKQNLMERDAADADADGKLDDLMSTVNHPSRRGHALVVTELIGHFE